jgi:hypothetical protein
MGRASKSSNGADRDQVQFREVASEDVGSGVEREPESTRLAVKLPPKQRIVRDALAAGCSAAEAARRANVDESTVRRWRNDDAQFIAAYNALLLDNVKSSRAEMASLLPLASAALRKDLEKGNGWLALQFYREARSLGLLEVGPTSPEAVTEELKLAQQLHEAKLMKKQVRLREQQAEIDKVKEKLDQCDEDRQIEIAQQDDYWYAWMAFHSLWEKKKGNKGNDDTSERHNAELEKERQKMREERERYARGRDEVTDALCERVMEEADRLQQVDQEKKQRGEHLKPIEERVNDLYNQDLWLNEQCRAKERDALLQQPEEQHAEAQPPAVEQQSSIDPQPAPDSRRRDEPHPDVEHAEAKRPAATGARPAAEHRPADDSVKANPDIEPFDSLSLAQDRPPELAQKQFARSAENPPGVQAGQRDPDVQGV